VIYLAIVLGGFLVGLIVARWWALGAAVGVGIWIVFATNVDEVPGWFLGAMYAGLAGIGITAGVSTRKALQRASS
jgi:hypothetical protein